MPHRLVNRSIPKPEASSIAMARAVLEKMYQFIDTQEARRQHRKLDKQKFADDAARIAARRPRNEQDEILDEKKRRITVRLISGREIQVLGLTECSTFREFHKSVRLHLGIPTNATSISMRLTFESGVQPHAQNFRQGQHILADDALCYNRRSRGCLRGCTLLCVTYRPTSLQSEMEEVD